MIPAGSYRKTRGIIRRGLRIDQPTATEVLEGTLYYVTDELLLERSNGTTWESYSGGGTSSSMVNRVISGTTTILDKHSLVVVDYIEITGSGELVIEGDGALAII